MHEGPGFFNGGPQGFGMGAFLAVGLVMVSDKETHVISDKRTSTLVKTVTNVETCVKTGRHMV